MGDSRQKNRDKERSAGRQLQAGDTAGRPTETGMVSRQASAYSQGLWETAGKETAQGEVGRQGRGKKARRAPEQSYPPAAHLWSLAAGSLAAGPLCRRLLLLRWLLLFIACVQVKVVVTVVAACCNADNGTIMRYVLRHEPAVSNQLEGLITLIQDKVIVTGSRELSLARSGQRLTCPTDCLNH